MQEAGESRFGKSPPQREKNGYGVTKLTAILCSRSLIAKLASEKRGGPILGRGLFDTPTGSLGIPIQLVSSFPLSFRS